MENVWIQLIITGGMVIASVIAAVRYAILQSGKSQKTLLQYIEKRDAQMSDYHERKNGHMERMAQTFASSQKEFAKALNKLSTKIEIHTVTKKDKSV
jgi:hypothetical protein